MSQYGICGGFNDGCVKVQTELATLFGLVEANFVEGGLLKDSGVLAASPKTPIVDWLPTMAPCYCLLDYANAFDVIKPLAQGLVDFEELVGSTDVPDVAGFFLNMVGTCNTDECKHMMNMTYVFFSDILVSGGFSGGGQQCTATAVAECSASDPASGSDDWWDSSECTPPSQGQWYGSLFEEPIPSDGWWQSIYWGLCFFGTYCPAPGISAYTMSTSVTVANAEDVDTQAEQDAIRDAYVDMLNAELGGDQIAPEDVTVSVSGADVTFELTTNSEAVKVQTENTLEGGGNVTMLNVPVAPGESFSAAAVTTIVYPPPPPAPGFKEDAGQSNLNSGGGNDDDDDNLIIIIAAVAGGLGALLICACTVCVVAKMCSSKPKKQSATAQGWQAGGPVKSNDVNVKMPL